MSLRTHVGQYPLGTLSARERWLLPARGNPYSGAEVPPDANLPAAEALRAARREKGWIEQLGKLSDTAGVPVLADYYRSRALATLAHLPAGDTEVADPRDRLDALCSAPGYLWWARGKSLLLRQRDSYMQRLYEVPDSWMLATIERMRHRRLVPTFGDMTRALQLTDEQIEGLWCLRPAVWYESDVPGVRALLAILAEPAQSGRKLSNSSEPTENNPIRYAEMSRRQRSWVPALAVERDEPVPAEELNTLEIKVFGPTPVWTVSGSGYRRVDVTINEWWTTGDRGDTCEIPLPVSLPDDRRDRMRIEIAKPS